MPFGQTQKGLTAISIAVLLALAGFAVFLIFKLAPPYIEYYGVQDSINSLTKELEIRDKSKDDVLKLLRKRLEVNDVTSVKPQDILIKKSGKVLTVQIDYEVRIPLLGNIDLALSFHPAIEIQ
jgi:Domain of unknown function (DUF4845)